MNQKLILRIAAVISGISGIIILFVLGRLLMIPIKIAMKLVYNTLIGGVVLIITNFIGNIFGFHIALNIVSALTVGILGIPGVALLAVFKNILKA